MDLQPPINFQVCDEKDWKQFKELFYMYLNAANLVEEKGKRLCALLLYCLGPKYIEVCKQFKISTQDENNLEVLVAKFDEFFTTHNKIIYARYSFFNRTQNEKEDVSPYLNELCNLASSCGFGAMKDELIRDRFISGIRSNKFRQELLKTSNLTLNKCMDACNNISNREYFPKALVHSFSNSVLISKHSYCDRNNFHAISQEVLIDSGKAVGGRNNSLPSISQSSKNVEIYYSRKPDTKGFSSMGTDLGSYFSKLIQEFNQNDNQIQPSLNTNEANVHLNRSSYLKHISNSENLKEIIDTQKFIKNCTRCGNSHKINNCPAYGKKCFKCDKMNHFQTVCKSPLKIKLRSSMTRLRDAVMEAKNQEYIQVLHSS